VDVQLVGHHRWATVDAGQRRSTGPHRLAGIADLLAHGKTADAVEAEIRDTPAGIWCVRGAGIVDGYADSATLQGPCG
jgi:hypothetical protein